MPKSKHRKNHKKKSQARKSRIKSEKNRIAKVQESIYKQMLKEIEEGKFDNTEKLPNNDDNINNDIIQLEGN